TFRIKTDLAELRVSRSPNGTLIGAERLLADSYVKDLPPVKQDRAAPSRELVVDPKLDYDDQKNQKYKSLQGAWLNAQGGDRIRLRLDGEIKLDRCLSWWTKEAELTLSADPGFHPVLVVDATEDAPSLLSLFDIQRGKVHVQGLEIRLHSRQDVGDGAVSERAAVVRLGGDGECHFKDCLITLAGGDKSSVKLALAVLRSERRNVTQMPHLRLDNCLVRGRGDLVWTRADQAAEVDLDKSLIALSGSLLNIASDKEADKDNPQPSSSAELTLRLGKVTTYLGEHLVRLHAKDAKTLLKTEFMASACLFLPAGEKALVRLEGMQNLRDKFVWQGSSKNAYGNYTPLLELQALDMAGKVDMSMSKRTSLEAWKSDVSRETDSEYNVNLPNLPTADADFTRLSPSAFQPGDSLKNYGADLAKLRALPALQSHADAAEPKPVD
ncbi:MAG: hypothetical protein ACRELF_16815, partial [Gemmataceae bacterium]